MSRINVLVVLCAASLLSALTPRVLFYFSHSTVMWPSRSIRLLLFLSFSLFAFNFYRHSPLTTVLLILLFFVLYIASWMDLALGIIPDSCHVALMLLGAVSAFRSNVLQIHFNDQLLGFLIVSVPMLLIHLLLYGFGFGDVKLMAAAGFLLGWKLILIAFGLACILCSVIYLPRLLRRRIPRDSRIPFAPYLSFGILISFIFGNHISMLFL